MRWPPKNELLRKAREGRGLYRCNCCKELVPLSVKVDGKLKRNVEVNHKVPVTLPGAWDGWDNFIERLFVEEGGLEVLCSDCHSQHTSLLRSLEEVWATLPQNENYQVSTFGRVRHKVNGLRKLVKDPRYLRVRLWDTNSKSYQFCPVHRLVATAFLPNPNNLPFVNHKDGYKLNNFLHNLEWVSAKGNSTHAAAEGLLPTGEDHWKHRGVWETPYGVFNSLDEAAKVCPISRSAIYKLCKDPNQDDWALLLQRERTNRQQQKDQDEI